MELRYGHFTLAASACTYRITGTSPYMMLFSQMLYLISNKQKYCVIRREQEAGYRLYDVSADFHLILKTSDVIKE